MSNHFDRMHIMRPDAIKVYAFTDGTNTIAQFFSDGTKIAQGHARRHKSDPVNRDLGMSLALGRMFEQLADVYAANVAHLTASPHNPSEYAEKNLRRMNREHRQKVRDHKRRVSREIYRELHGGEYGAQGWHE